MCRVRASDFGLIPRIHKRARKQISPALAAISDAVAPFAAIAFTSRSFFRVNRPGLRLPTIPTISGLSARSRPGASRPRLGLSPPRPTRASCAKLEKFPLRLVGLALSIFPPGLSSPGLLTVNIRCRMSALARCGHDARRLWDREVFFSQSDFSLVLV